MGKPVDRSGDDLFDNGVTAARERAAGRLLGDAGSERLESMAFAEEGDDAEDDENLTAEERAMHLTRAPSFDEDDGYVAE